MISLLFWPFLSCVSLVLIHVYFGGIVLGRGVLFIDIALAQWAAFGYLFAKFLGIQSDAFSFVLAFFFSFFAAVSFVFLKQLFRSVHLQEAVIGILYILAVTVSITMISFSGMEGGHMKEILSGHLLFVQPQEWFWSMLMYSMIGIAIFFYKQHLLKDHWFSDLVFYGFFSFIVTFSVKMVGVLLVFSMLVIPNLMALMLSKNKKTRLFLGWGIGGGASLLGLISSMIIDLAPSICIVLWLCLSWLLLTVITFFNGSKEVV